MRAAGGASWEFRSNLGFPTHASLYVRDALKLDTSSDDAAPPPLAAHVADRSAHLGEPARVEAVNAWLGVWHSLLDRPDSPFVALETLKRVPFDPVLWDEAVRWSNAVRRDAVMTGPSGPIGWDVIDETVTAVARDLGVDRNTLHGSAEFLLVRGPWWRLARPGLVLASLETAANPDMAARMLRAAFVSGLEA